MGERMDQRRTYYLLGKELSIFLFSSLTFASSQELVLSPHFIDKETELP
jgi:hypothetical protein